MCIHTVVFVKLHSWCEGQWMILIVCRVHLLSTLVIYPAVEKHCTSALCTSVRATEPQSQKPIDTHLASQHLIVLTAWSWVSPIASSREIVCACIHVLCTSVSVRAQIDKTRRVVVQWVIVLSSSHFQMFRKREKPEELMGSIWWKFLNSLVRKRLKLRFHLQWTSSLGSYFSVLLYAVTLWTEIRAPQHPIWKKGFYQSSINIHWGGQTNQHDHFRNSS